MQYLNDMTSSTTSAHQTPRSLTREIVFYFYTMPLQDDLRRIKVSIPGLKLVCARTNKRGERNIPAIKYACPGKTRIRALRPRSLVSVLI